MLAHRPITLDHPSVTLADTLRAAEQIAQRLRSLSSSVGPSSLATQFYTRIRVKSEQSIRDKIVRNQSGDLGRSPDPNYSFSAVDDYIGFRIVTLYDGDLNDAMRYVIDLVKAGQELPEHLFEPGLLWNSFEKAKFFKRFPVERDRYTLCRNWLRRYIKADIENWNKQTGENISAAHYTNPKKLEVREPRENEYSSAHLIFNAISYPSRRYAASLEFDAIREVRSVDVAPLRLAVEFQVRAAHEDLWGEVNHTYLYKIASPYAWSPAFSAAYNRASVASRRLKDAINDIPPAIDDLIAASKEASLAIKSFEEPETAFHFSLGTSLFWHLRSDYHRALNGDSKRTLHGIFEQYRLLCAAIGVSATPAQNAETTQLAIRKIREAQQEIKRLLATTSPTIRRPSVRQGLATDIDEDNPEFIFLTQRELLCEFDILRLRSLVALEYHIEISDDFETYIDIPYSNNGPVDKGPYIRLYGLMCQLKDNRFLRIRPLSALLYWKYLLAQKFDPATARRNLLDAYSQLEDDLATPKWSVYRVKIPRDLAFDLAEEAQNTVKRVEAADIDPRLMSGLAREIKTQLLQALKYALEAFIIYYRDTDPMRTGDFIYGAETNDKIKDAEQVLDIYLGYVVYFNEPVTKSRSVSIADLQKVLNYIEEKRNDPHNPLDRCFSEESDRQRFEKLFSDARDWVKKEVSDLQTKRG